MNIGKKERVRNGKDRRKKIYMRKISLAEKATKAWEKRAIGRELSIVY